MNPFQAVKSPRALDLSSVGDVFRGDQLVVGTDGVVRFVQPRMGGMSRVIDIEEMYRAVDTACKLSRRLRGRVDV
jgi:hypothetical protein